MTNYIATDALNARRTGRTAILSSSVDGFAPWTWTGLSGIRSTTVAKNPIDKDGNARHVVQTTHWGRTGGEAAKNNHWDKILLQKQSNDFKTVLSKQDFTIEVWSTFRDRTQTLNTIVQSGPGNLALTNTFGLPLLYQPEQSRIYPASLPGLGDPNIASNVTFTFAGITPVTYRATGSRIIVFWPACDWSEPFQETLAWFTLVDEFFDGSEQRAQARSVPRYSITYKIMTLDERQTQTLENWLYKFQTEIWAIPMWPEKSPLLDTATATGNTISVDSSDRPSFVVGSQAMIWAGPLSWEVQTIQSMTAGTLTFISPLTKTWPAGTMVVPLRKGFMDTSVTAGRPMNWITIGTFAFECEAF